MSSTDQKTVHDEPIEKAIDRKKKTAENNPSFLIILRGWIMAFFAGLAGYIGEHLYDRNFSMSFIKDPMFYLQGFSLTAFMMGSYFASQVLKAFPRFHTREIINGLILCALKAPLMIIISQLFDASVRNMVLGGIPVTSAIFNSTRSMVVYQIVRNIIDEVAGVLTATMTKNMVFHVIKGAIVAFITLCIDLPLEFFLLRRSYVSLYSRALRSAVTSIPISLILNL